MKKVFLLLMIVSWQVSFAQDYDFPGYTWSSYGNPKENGSYITLVTATRTTDYDFFPETRKLSSTAGPEVQSAAFLAHRPNHVYWVTTYDTSRALFFVRGLDRKTAADYEFRVLLNGHEALAPWSDITQVLRCHQSHLVNKEYIRSWLKEDGDFLLLEDGARLPVSRQKKEYLKALFR